MPITVGHLPRSVDRIPFPVPPDVGCSGRQRPTTYARRQNLNTSMSLFRRLVENPNADQSPLEGPATATALADRLGVLPGSTTWHLSKLAEHGYIEEVPELGNRRDRWWRSIKVLLQYAEAMEAGPNQARSTTEFMITGLGQDLARAVAFLRQEWDFEWRHAAIFNNYDQLFLDPPTLEQLRSELWSLLGRYTQNPSTTPQASRVIFTMQAYPYRPNDPSSPTSDDPATG